MQYKGIVHVVQAVSSCDLPADREDGSAQNVTKCVSTPPQLVAGPNCPVIMFLYALLLNI